MDGPFAMLPRGDMKIETDDNGHVSIYIRRSLLILRKWEFVRVEDINIWLP